MKRWMKWVLEGAAIYGALVLLMAFLWPGQKLQPEKNEITAVAETEEPGTEEEEEGPQPELSDWKTLSDVEVSEAIQEQGPDETLIFLESLTEEEREDLLLRKTCLKDKKTAIGQREFIALETRIKTFRIFYDRLKAEGDSELLGLFAMMDRMLVAAENRKLSDEILCDGICASLAAEILCQKKTVLHTVETRKTFLKWMKDEAYRFRKCKYIDRSNAEQDDEESRISAETYRLLQDRYRAETEEQIRRIKEAEEEPEDPEPEEEIPEAKEKPKDKSRRNKEPLQEKLRRILLKKEQKIPDSLAGEPNPSEEREEIPLGGEYCLRTTYAMAKAAPCPNLLGYLVMQNKEGEIFVGPTECFTKGNMIIKRENF